MTTYEVKNGIPAPQGYSRKDGGKYPFKKMKKGDHFDVPIAKNTEGFAADKLVNRVRSSAYGKKPMKFVLRLLRDENCIRCWRVF